jgi:CHAT domain-containing protein/Tfp pilus assembly protein PilF
VLFLSCVVRFDQPLGVSSLAQTNDDDPIRMIVGRLFESYQKKDLDKLISLWSEKSPFLRENKQNLQREFSAYMKISVKGFEIRQSKIDGGKATLRVAAEMALTRAKTVKPAEKIEKKNRTMELVNEGGSWKIWKFIASEEELATAIVAAKTGEEWEVLMEKESELITSDLVAILARSKTSDVAYQSGYQHALAINQLADRLAEQIGDPGSTAIVANNAGYIYGWLGTPEKSPEMALEYFRKSLRIGEAGGLIDVIAKSHISSAVIYHSLGDYPHATEYYLKSLKLSEELSDDGLLFQGLNNLGTIYRQEGNFAKALELMLKCLKLSESRPDSESYWEDLTMVLGNIGSILTSQENHEQALAYFQRAYEASQKVGKIGSPNARMSKALIVAQLGLSHFLRGNYTLAKEYYQKSLDLAEEVENTLLNRNDSYIAWLKTKIGDVFIEEKNTAEAIVNYQEALRLAEKSRDKTRLSKPLQSLSNSHLMRGDFREALAFSDRAVKAAEQAGQYPFTIDALVTTAKAYQKLAQPEEANQALLRAIDLTEHLRGQFAGAEIDRQRAFEYYVTPYQAMVDFMVNQKQYTEAFTFSQRAKGRTLLELLQNGRVNISKSASPAESEQEQQLKRKLGSLNRQLSSEKLKSQPDGKRLTDLEAQLEKARLEFDSFQSALYAAHPELKVRRGEIRPISFDDVAELIPDAKTVLMDFIVTDEYVHLFVLTKGASSRPTLNTYTIKIERKSLSEMVERFRGRMENRDYDFQSLSKELYCLFIMPAQDQLRNKTSLIISPDNVLWDLPFQTLLSPESRYLIEDAAISYAPSLSVLKEMRLESMKNQSPARASLLALGNPALGNRSVELARFAKMGAELQPLPEAAVQVRALGRLYGATTSKVYTGPAAREEVVKEQSDRYRILHLATHGLLNDASPMYSQIMLSQTNGKSDEDGLLEAWEMMNLDLNADLVVLSACETARGRVGAGEGVIGMTWALFVAGCPRTVVSQWKVEASSTTALMLEFHKKFKTRYGGKQPAVSTAEAMRQAALKLMKNPEYAHPFYWGGFVVVGDGN